MTRNGKIARLPKAVREKLNKDLENGVPGVRLVEWLNSLPEVKQVLKELFEGRPINEVNLSEWKGGGFVDWQARQELVAHAQELAETADGLVAATPQNLSEHLNVVVAGHYAKLLNQWNGTVDEGFLKQLKGLRLLCQDVAVIRRGDVLLQRFDLDKAYWEKSIQDFQMKAMEAALAESKKYPEAAVAFRKAFDLLRAYTDGKKKNEPYLAQKRKRCEAKQERANNRWAEKRRLEIAEEERQRQEQHAKIDARMARWQEAHPGVDPVEGKWWDWQEDQAVGHQE